MRSNESTLKRRALRVASLLRRKFCRLPFGCAGERSLADRLTGLLLLSTVFMYITINAGLWWTAASMIDDNLLRQAERWVVEFDELGTPLYVSRRGQRLVRVDERIKNFPEIAYVRYFDAARPAARQLRRRAAEGAGRPR
ncbi:MAG: hypothetical protein MZV65_33545 [Chromatiales bacterium]|nr:hypothetical protein [Chromatiales bacterium]